MLVSTKRARGVTEVEEEVLDSGHRTKERCAVTAGLGFWEAKTYLVDDGL